MTKRPLAILTADLHLRDTKPANRTDDYWKAQWCKIDFILDLQQRHKIPILCAGDMLDKWNCSSHLLYNFMARMSTQFPIHVIVGQHEQPFHNMDLIKKSGISVLEQMEYFCTTTGVCGGQARVGLDELHGYHWGQLPTKPVDIEGVIMLHELVYKGKKPFPDCQGYEVNDIFDLFPNAKLVITGDNHKPFTATRGDQLLVNPGSMMRMTTDQVNHKPRVYIWYSDNTVEPVYLPIEDDIFDLSNVGKIKDREDRISHYVEKLKEGVVMKTSFPDNLESYFKKNKTHKEIKRLIMEAIDG